MKAALKALTAIVLCGGSAPIVAGSPPVHVTEGHGFVDIDLPIAAIVQDPGQIRVTIRGDVDGTEVGFELDFPSKNGPARQTLFPLGTARLRSLGTLSDHFVAFLAQRYSVPAAAKTMVSSLNASVAGLHGDPEHVLDDATEMKFSFFDSGPKERYAKLFINVDAKNRILQFHEKDPDYRMPLVLDLTKDS